MRYVFGPVPSRRLGRSLGVDPIPFKTCNWNCVYCQLGRTAPLASRRAELAQDEEILAEIAKALEGEGAKAVDWITFVGSGETTLHAGLGRLLRAARALTPLPIAVLTNGSLLDRGEVRRELRVADAVLPSLDAGNERLYQRLNRPHRAFSFERLVSGLVAFRAEYPGQLWIEVMLVAGMNDSDEALRELGTLLERIGPDEVHLNVPRRPPSEPWVRAPGSERLQRACDLLGRIAHVVPARGPDLDLSRCRNPVEAILRIVRRHPLEDGELRNALARWSGDEVDSALAALLRTGEVRRIRRADRTYWTDSRARF